MARISMRSNRKFMRLCRDIQRPPYQVRGLLEMMWESAHENEPTFPTLDDAEVVSTWDGETGMFGKALLACGFLDAVDGGFFVHDYWQHAPGWVREREKKRRQRDAAGTDEGRSGDKPGTTSGQAGDASSHGAPSVAKRSVEKPREEEIKIPPLGGAGCPLSRLHDLTGSYAAIREKLIDVHPHAKLPEPGSAKEFADRQELERIVRLDGYSEESVIDTLAYVLMDEPHNDRFMWRDQFRSFSGLRKVNDGATKFSRMHDAMQKFREANIRAAAAEAHHE